MNEINLEMNEEAVRTIIQQKIAQQRYFTIQSDDGGGCPLGFHLVVTGTGNETNVDLQVSIVPNS